MFPDYRDGRLYAEDIAVEKIAEQAALECCFWVWYEFIAISTHIGLVTFTISDPIEVKTLKYIDLGEPSYGVETVNNRVWRCVYCRNG